MWKVLIADDEPKIRRGLKNAINWPELDMELVGEAEDGEMALEIAQNMQPDILLVDICMPFLNGLQFIEKLKYVLNDCIVIVVTGHDEFAYAQQAIKLQVFDYLLKPVGREQLYMALRKAQQKLVDSCVQDRYMSWASRETKKNLPFLRETFCKEWMSGRLTASDIAEQLTFLDVALPPVSGIIIMKATGRCTQGQLFKEWDRKLLLAAMQNIADENLQEWSPHILFCDDEDNLVAITAITNQLEWHNLGDRLQQVLERQLNQVVVICHRPIADLMTCVPTAYHELIMEVKRKISYTPAVFLCQKYIETNFYKEELSLKELAEAIRISPTYLSRLLKQEIGLSFIDYLTHVRVQKAIQLMSDSAVKLYEVAERVGYSNQYYFSTAFKKVVGLSPAEYRKRGDWG
jgi:two-component system, response regulator YesN